MSESELLTKKEVRRAVLGSRRTYERIIRSKGGAPVPSFELPAPEVDRMQSIINAPLEWDAEREGRVRHHQLTARADLSEYLQGFDWSYFITVTTRKPWQDAIALNKAVYSNLNESTAIERAFICTEPYDIRSGVHAHGIVKADSKYMDFVGPSRVWANLFSQFGRSKVELVRSTEDVTGYCSKYVTKSHGDYYLWGRKELWKSSDM